jgi:hypothetical protein
MMKNILSVCCGIVATTAVLSAQTPAPQTPTTSSTTSTTRQTAQTVTVTGCVTPDLTANPDPASATTRRFLLSNIEPSGQARVSGYILTPNADVNLSDHLNHKVQITGTVESVTSSSTTSQSSPSTSSTTQSSTTTMPSFRVTSVKMVSATCP